MFDSPSRQNFTVRITSSDARVRLAKRDEKPTIWALRGARRLTVSTWKVDGRTIGFKLASVPKSSFSLPVSVVHLKGIVRDRPPEPSQVVAQEGTNWPIYILSVLSSGLVGVIFAWVLTESIQRAAAADMSALDPRIAIPLGMFLALLLMIFSVVYYEFQRRRLWRELYGALGHLHGIDGDL